MIFQPKKFLVILLSSFWLCFSPQLIDFLALPVSGFTHQQVIVLENGSSAINLKDETESVWELTVWQEAQKEDSDIYLRLVGYPLFQIDHKQPLKFSDATHSPVRAEAKLPKSEALGKARQDSDRNRVLVELEDLYTPKTPAFHVAKYSIKDILSQLPRNETLDLSFSLTGNRPVHLKVPPEVITQWQELNNTKSESSDRNIPLHKASFLLA